MLAAEFLEPLGLTQVELARLIDVPLQRINLIINRKRGITPDTALRLSRLFSTTAELWLNLQRTWDLYEALRSPKAEEIQRIRPLKQSRLACARAAEPPGRSRSILPGQSISTTTMPGRAPAAHPSPSTRE